MGRMRILVLVPLLLLLACQDDVERARAALAAKGGADPMARMELARRLAVTGQHEEALEHYLWCFDRGAERDPTFGSVRFSILLSAIAELGESYPPARQALAERRDALASFDVVPDTTTLVELRRLDEALGQPERTVEVFDALIERGDQTRRARRRLLTYVAVPLARAKRYADILDPVDAPVSWIKRRKVDVAMIPLVDPTDTSRRDRALGRVVIEGSAFYEALLGTGRADEARELGALLIEWAPEGDTAAALADRAERAGHPDVARAWRER